MPKVIGIFLGAVLAGTLGGLLGIGGGIVLMPILRFFAGLPPALAAGTCVVAVFFTTLGGSWRHYRLRHVDIRSIIPIIIAGACATVVFSLIFSYLTTRERWLDLGMGLVFSLVSIRMIIEGLPSYLRKPAAESGEGEIRGSLLPKFAIGGAAGVLPGLLGIGTGAILVPAFTFILRAPIKIAVGSSLACFSVNALLSSVFKFFQGFIDMKLIFPLCLGTLIGSNMGAMLNRHLPTAALKLMFGIFFLCVSLRFILSFSGITI